MGSSFPILGVQNSQNSWVATIKNTVKLPLKDDFQAYLKRWWNSQTKL